MMMQPLESVSASVQAFLSAPEQLLQQSMALQLAVASFPDTPRSLLEILVNSPEEQVAEAAQLHVNLAGEMTDGWQQAVDERLQTVQLGQNDRLAVELLKLGPVPPCFFSEWVPAERLIQGLRNPYMPLRYRLQLLERLAQEPTLEPRLQVAESSETPSSLLEQLAGDLELPIRLAVKFNPGCPPPLIELVEGQHAVASDWSTDGEQLAMLGQSRWAWVRLAVGQNPNAAAETLLQLAQDALYKIQLAVAKNPGTPAEVLAVLAEHRDTAVQAAVAEHENATEEILHQLFPTQQHLLKKRKNLPTSILERFFNEAATNKPIWTNYELQYLLLTQPNTPTRILAEVANVDLEALRSETLGTHQQPPSPEVLEKWVQDKISFLADVAKHPQVSVEILERLTQYPNLYVHLAVAQNSQTPVAIRMQLFEELALSTEERILKALATDANTPISILEKIIERESEQNKFRVKLHRLLTRKPDEDNRESSADLCMDEARKILAQYQASVNVEEWMTLIESYQWMTLLENYTYYGNLAGRYHRDEDFRNLVNEQWCQLLPTVPESALQGVIAKVLKIPDLLLEVVKGDRAVAVALVGNPKTPVALREELQKRLTQPLEKLGSYGNDCDLRMALAYNPQVPKAQRIEYFQQLLSTGWNNIHEGIARNPNTPPEILAHIMTKKGVGRQAVSRNPNAPASALAELARDDNSTTRSWVAENPGTPVDILLQLALAPVEKTINNVSTVRGTVLKNPNFPPLERYRLLLAMDEEQETANAHQLMAHRPDSPYALAQVVQQGNQNAKLTVARSHKTPIHVLEQLAKDPDETVRQAVSQNSNLPLSSLLELASDPSIKVHLGLVHKSSHQKTSTPIQLLERLAQHESEQVRARVAENPNTPVELLIKLANDTSREVKAKLTGNLNTPVTVLERLGLEEAIFNVRNPNTPGSVLAQAIRKLAPNPRSTPRRTTSDRSDESLADLIKFSGWTKDSQMPASILEELSDHGYCVVRSKVADHPNTPASALEHLCDDEWSPVRAGVAKHPNTPPHILERMARREDPNGRDNYYYTVCSYIAQRSDAPAGALAFLSHSRMAQIRQIVAGNSSTPLEVLTQMINSETDESVLQRLARNPNLTSDLLGLIAQKPDSSVRTLLIYHPNITAKLWMQLARDETTSIRQAIATNSNIPVEVLQNLSRDEDSEVRVKVAANSNLPPDFLEVLAIDSNASVRGAVAINPNTPQSVLENLAQDEKVEVRRAVAQNPNTPAPIRETLSDLVLQPITSYTSPTLRGLSRIYNPSTDDLATLLGEYARSENAFVRFVAIMHPLIPREVLQQAANSNLWQERYAVADNLATPTELRQRLAQDSNCIVRAVARVYL